MKSAAAIHSYGQAAGLVVRNPVGKEIYCQPGDDANRMRDNIESLDEISPDTDNAKRATIADMMLGEYFS